MKNRVLRLCAMIIWGICAVALPMTSHTAFADEKNVTPASIKSRTAPAYPATCYTDNEKSVAEQKVILSYDVSQSGTTENVVVLFSSDPCFEESTIASVETWRFNPRTEDGKKTIQKSMQTTLRFQLSAPTDMLDIDAKPIFRVPPEYPEKCARLAGKEEYVVLEFDISPKGIPENIQAIEATRGCFKNPALTALKKWKYSPKLIDGKPVQHQDVVTRITFLLQGAGTQDRPVRAGFLSKAKTLSRQLNAEKFEKANKTVDDIVAKYSDDFSPHERAVFHQLRGSLRLSEKNYTGALDDLRIARKGIYLDEKARIAIGNTIEQLEKAMGIQ